jgi:F0F1-type ATP synthase membrane subunit b/b'
MNKTQKMKIETPIGSVESDSGNHLIDVVSIAFIIFVFFVSKKLWSSIK